MAKWLRRSAAMFGMLKHFADDLTFIPIILGSNTFTGINNINVVDVESPSTASFFKMEDIKKILVNKDGKYFYIRDIKKDFHCQFGMIKKSYFNKKKAKSNTGEEFSVLDPSFIDKYRKLKRNAQIVKFKDIGMIIANTGLNKESKVIDAGAGSGFMACALANIAKEVITYEIRKDFYELVKGNIKFLGLKNLKIKNKDVYEKITERNVDVITFDLTEPWRAVDNAEKSLKRGGFLVSYSPTIPQVIKFVDKIAKNKSFINIKTVELMQREWIVEDPKVRPINQQVVHTGFLTFARKI